MIIRKGKKNWFIKKGEYNSEDGSLFFFTAVSFNTNHMLLFMNSNVYHRTLWLQYNIYTNNIMKQK